MSLRPYKGITPTLKPSAYVDEAAVVIGDVELATDSSVWPMAVVRGDVNTIRIGERSNVQDGAVLHVTHDHPGAPGGFSLIIGDEVTIGHNVTLHGCTIGNRCLVGMGATVLDGATLEEGVLLAAGSLVPPGKTLEGGYLWLGSPVKKGRPLTQEEWDRFSYSARHYARLKDEYRSIANSNVEPII
ncbi:MAG: gamma carbonic anhydrase family protein [Pseudomonadota bacterium]